MLWGQWAVEAPWWVWAASGEVSAGIQAEVTAVLAKCGQGTCAEESNHKNHTGGFGFQVA